MLVRVYIAQKRKIRVGDKMAGRPETKGLCLVLFQLKTCLTFSLPLGLVQITFLFGSYRIGA